MSLRQCIKYIVIKALIAISIESSAQVVEDSYGPYIEGYQFHVYLFPSPDALMEFFCGTDTYWAPGINYTKGKIQYVGDGLIDYIHEPFHGWCKTDSGGEFTDGTWTFGWRRVCADNGFNLEPAGKVDEITGQLRYIDAGRDDDIQRCVSRATDMYMPAKDPLTCPRVSNPVHPLTGTKVENIVDFRFNDDSNLGFERIYRSIGATPSSVFGNSGMKDSGWRHSHESALGLSEHILSRPSIQSIELPDVEFVECASLTYYYYTNTGWQPRQYACGSGFVMGNAFFSLMTSAGTSLNFWEEDGAFRSTSEVEEVVSAVLDASGRRTHFTVRSPSSATFETYDSSGRYLLKRQTADGKTLIYRYADGTIGANGAPAIDAAGNPLSTPVTKGALLSVANDFGRRLGFRYDIKGRLVRLEASDGSVVRYGYDEKGFLSEVTLPDNTTRKYLYNEASSGFESGAFGAYLTGLIDEKGVRYGNYEYRGGGQRVSVSEHVGGVDRHTFSYIEDSGLSRISSVTDANGASTRYDAGAIKGVSHVTATTQPAGSGCATAAANSTYDSRGNAVAQWDFNGSLSCYAFEPKRPLETVRLDAMGGRYSQCPAAVNSHILAGEQKRTETLWHPDWHLRVATAEPKKITYWVYNGQPDPSAGGAVAICAPTDARVAEMPIAVLCKRVEQATSDANGAQGFGAALVGQPRIWSWTYNAVGQKLSETGPRGNLSPSDPDYAADVMTWSYATSQTADHMLGDLVSHTNPMGHVTQFTQHDRAGRVLRRVAPSGATAQYAYHPRDRFGRSLGPVKSNGQAMDYTYHPAGWVSQESLSAPGGQPMETSYSYTPTGLVDRIVSPDGVTTMFTYDDAHRLIRVEDSQGNMIRYTLDAMGNKVSESTFDATGALHRRIDFSYDALGRVQAVGSP